MWCIMLYSLELQLRFGWKTVGYSAIRAVNLDVVMENDGLGDST